MTDWKQLIKVLEDVIRDFENESAYDNDRFNLEISQLREILEQIKLKLEKEVVREYAYMAVNCD